MTIINFPFFRKKIKIIIIDYDNNDDNSNLITLDTMAFIIFNFFKNV